MMASTVQSERHDYSPSFQSTSRSPPHTRHLLARAFLAALTFDDCCQLARLYAEPDVMVRGGWSSLGG
jgi:hypothetical protein